jgi:hypothetical protein
MKRVVIAVCLLAAALLAGVLSTVTLCRACDSLAAELTQVRDLAEQGETQEAAERLDAAYRHWQKDSPLFHALVDHQLMTDAEISIRKARYAARTGDCAAMAAETNNCVENLNHIKDSSEPTFSNIF